MLVTNENKREFFYKELKATDLKDGTPMGDCMIIPLEGEVLLLTDSTLLGWDILEGITEEYLEVYKRNTSEKVQKKYPYGWWLTDENYYKEDTQSWSFLRGYVKLHAATPETKVVKLGKYRVKTR